MIPTIGLAKTKTAKTRSKFTILRQGKSSIFFIVFNISL